MKIEIADLNGCYTFNTDYISSVDYWNDNEVCVYTNGLSSPFQLKYEDEEKAKIIYNYIKDSM